MTNQQHDYPPSPTQPDQTPIAPPPGAQRFVRPPHFQAQNFQVQGQPDSILPPSQLSSAQMFRPSKPGIAQSIPSHQQQPPAVPFTPAGFIPAGTPAGFIPAGYDRPSTLNPTISKSQLELSAAAPEYVPAGSRPPVTSTPTKRSGSSEHDRSGSSSRTASRSDLHRIGQGDGSSRRESLEQNLPEDATDLGNFSVRSPEDTVTVTYRDLREETIKTNPENIQPAARVSHGFPPPAPVDAPQYIDPNPIDLKVIGMMVQGD